MKQRLSSADTIGLGLMVFAFFLGAGNIIFPPFEGQQAGTHVFYTMSGFLLTAVGLPLLSIIAVARAGGGLPVMTRDLPKGTGVFAAILVFIIIGPAFAVPRTALVSYTMAIQPLFTMSSNVTNSVTHFNFLDINLDIKQLAFSSLFFILTMFFSWNRGKLIGYVGKFLTPLLFLLLCCLAIGVVFDPQGALTAPVASYSQKGTAFTNGFTGGYGTMDTFAALMFGVLLVDVLRTKGITKAEAFTHYLTIAGLIAAVGLCFVYVSLFWLGATSSTILPHASNGGDILTSYVQALFGAPGQLILSCVVYLACLTTAVGVLSACADYFSTLSPLNYRAWIVVLCIVSTIVSNVGLTRLIELSIPVLLALYPMAISLVVLTFVRKWLNNPRLSYRAVILIAFVFSMMDVFRHNNVQVFGIPKLLAWEQHYMPLASDGMAWFLPTLITLVIMFFWPKKTSH